MPYIDTLAADTSRRLQEVTIRAYLSEQEPFAVPASVSVLNAKQLARQPDNSFVTALNTIPGVRAEERSPGSYRLSIRGSLLRSPFGIRNVKIYFDELPLTDAGGNTYLNAIDINSIQKIEVLKGPDGSLFGANSGGVVRLSPVSGHGDSSYFKAGLNAGSYGLLHEQAAIQQSWNNNQLNINQSYQYYGGYRANSSMHRNYIQLVDKWKYAAKDELKVLALYTDLFYQTPGGLTLSQAIANPRAARPSTATLPGAIDQKIAVHTRLALVGLVNEIKLTGRIKNVLAVFGNHVDFDNPFITNYEQRNENTYGLRTYFELKSQQQEHLSWRLDLGMEWQQTNAVIGNYGNNKGRKDTAQSIDNLHTNQHFIFMRYSADLFHRLHAEAALSLNSYGYRFQNVYPLAQAGYNRRRFNPQLMPRLALSYAFHPDFIWRASVSRGYSTPTIAEVRPTDNVINTGLSAEYGWNYEAGFRLRNRTASLLFDASVFYYKLENAIVRRLNKDETEYFINAGGTEQPGFELAFRWWFVKPGGLNFIRSAQWSEAFSYSRFTFRNYIAAGTDYSGNQLTGVPPQVLVSGLQLNFPENLSFFLQHNYTEGIPLNDANTVYAGSYNLLQAKVSWEPETGHKIKLEVYVWADNLLNEKYSLGDDLNAVGSRYYNPAPLRNYTIGFKVTFP